MFKKTLVAAAVFCSGFVAQASAATLNGTFTIDIYQGTSLNAAQSRAIKSNLGTSGKFLETITYSGDLDFATMRGNATTIGDWLATGVGGSFSISAATAGLQLSKANINKGSATTTFFDITANFATAFDSVIRHDDGASVFDDGVQLVSTPGPTGVVTTYANGFDGGEWNLLYAATNSNPSILNVTGDNLPPAVPLPAGLPLLLAGVGAFAYLRRRQAA